MDDPRAPLTEPPDRRPAALMVAAAIAAIVLVAGAAIWLAGSDGDDITSSPATGATTTLGSATPPTSSTSPPTATTDATTAPSTTPTTAPPSTAPPTTEPDRFALPGPDATTWTVRSDFEPIAPEMNLQLATTVDDVRVFDGVAAELRCVGVVGPGDAVTSWCGAPGAPTRFVADRGAEPLLVELGIDTGSVSATRQPAAWTLASNGCSAPLSTILAGVDPGGLAVTGITCRGDDAFLGVGMALFGPGVAPDGGGVLAAQGDEGWNVVDFGTALVCDGLPDGVDRCERFGVASELFEALLPLPPADMLGATATDVVSVTDRTADVQGWIGGASDPDEVVSLVTGQLVDPEAEVESSVRRSAAFRFGRLQLLVVEIPQLDDAFATETWAVWIRPGDDGAGVTAFSWGTCRRGVTGDGLCV